MDDRNSILKWTAEGLGGLRWQVISSFCREVTEPHPAMSCCHVMYMYTELISHFAGLSYLLSCWISLWLSRVGWVSWAGFQRLLPAPSLLLPPRLHLLPLTEVLPIEKILRNSWDSSRYLRGSVEVHKPFLVEEGSRAHIHRIGLLMKSDYDWCCIGMVALLSSESDLIGSWAESCPCHSRPIPAKRHPGKRKERVSENKEAASCPFRCCRAPELAVGRGVTVLCEKMLSHKGVFSEIVATAPPAHQSELLSAWGSASSKLFGILA